MSYKVTIDWNENRTEVVFACAYKEAEGYIVLYAMDKSTKIYVNPDRALRVQIEETE